MTWLIIISIVAILLYLLLRDQNNKSSKRTEAGDVNIIKKNSGSLHYSINDNYLRIDRPNFFGQCHVSPSKRYILGWSDFHYESGIGGYREKGMGNYILIESGKLVVRGELERPNDGKVSDTGTFIINDWMFSEGLKGTFYVFSNSGEIIIKKLFKANLYNNGISADSKYAVCQTANSDYEPHSSILTIFDIHKRTSISEFKPQSGWARHYRFDSNNQIIELIYDQGRSYRYKFDGTFLDFEKWENDRKTYGSGYDLHSIAENQLKGLEGSELTTYSESIELLNGALEKGVSEYTQAKIHRLLGEIYNRCEKKEKAIEHLGMALKLNPKVGVKRLYDSLTKS